MRWAILRRRKDSNKPTTIKTNPSMLHWNKDTAIVFDPITRKFYKDSVSNIEENEPHEKVNLPKYETFFDCSIEMRGSNEKIPLGTIDLSKLGKTINLHRARGNIPHLYILGKAEAG